MAKRRTLTSQQKVQILHQRDAKLAAARQMRKTMRNRCQEPKKNAG